MSSKRPNEHPSVQQRRDLNAFARAMDKHLGVKINTNPEPVKQRTVLTGLRRALVQLLTERDGNTCYLCGQPFTGHRIPVVEHIIPRNHGGTDDSWNLALAHTECNVAKADRIVSFLASDRTPRYHRLS